jgi:peptide/nickel transport system permease protein
MMLSFDGWHRWEDILRLAHLVVTSRNIGDDPALHAKARQLDASGARILFAHVLPNTLGPVIILATLGLGVAILTEAILSFLGLGMSPTPPSLGALIRVGNDLLLSGEWWISMFPGLALVLLVLSVNIFGDWLRNALNPRLK